MRILLIDCDYPPFLDHLYASSQGLAQAAYAKQLQVRADAFFGDAPAQAAALRRRGHDAQVLHANARPLQRAWLDEHPQVRPARVRGVHLRQLLRGRRDTSSVASIDGRLLVAQVRHLRPDVVLVQSMQDLPRPVTTALARLAPLVGVVASPLPADPDLSPYRAVLSSLPSFVDRFRAAGADADLLPLAVDPEAREAVGEPARDVEVSFIGSISPAHRRRRDMLEALAASRDVDLWSDDRLERPGRARTHGAVWGRHMYVVLARSLVTINVHIDVAGDQANNLRLYEATGMGALLVTETATNLADYFLPGQEVITYRSASELVDVVEDVLADRSRLEAIALAGQMRTRRDHTWDDRAGLLLELLAARGLTD